MSMQNVTTRNLAVKAKIVEERQLLREGKIFITIIYQQDQRKIVSTPWVLSKNPEILNDLSGEDAAKVGYWLAIENESLLNQRRQLLR